MCACSVASAQSNGKITGTVTSAEKPLDAQIVTLLFAKDSAVAKTEITGQDGQFTFVNLKDDSYIIAFDNVGFASFQSDPISITAKNPAVQFSFSVASAEANKLDEVVIVKKKPFVEFKMDRTVLNVDALISNAGADAMEVLAKAPGIIVDQNGTITFKGKSGIAVFIDDKPTYLSGAELEIYLKSLGASTLDQIEIMSNPPAKYDAAGSAGVINIKTKRSKKRGFNGSVTARVSQGKRNQTRNSANVTYSDEKFRVFASGSHSDQKSVSELNIFRLYKNEDLTTKSLFDQNTLINPHFRNSSARIGIDYYLSGKTTIGFSASGIIKKGGNFSNAKGILKNAFLAIDSIVIAESRERQQFKNGTFNLNFSHEFDTIGRKITVDADFLSYYNQINQRYNNYIYQPDNTLSSSDELRGDLPSKIIIYTFKTDYVHPFKNEGLLEAGYKISYSNTDNIASYTDVIGDVSTPNYNSSNHFKYDEVINAAYVNYNKKIGRFSFQTGLRVESTISKGNQMGNVEKPASKFKRDYTNLFPTVYVMYQLDSIGNNEVSISYGKRIDRPYYQDLNPFLDPLDKFTYYSGNPYLNPSFSHTADVSYRYKSLFSTAVSYSRTKDEISETIEIRDGIYYSRPGNIGKSSFISINFQSDLNINKWYSLNAYTEITNMNYKSQLYTETLNTSGTFFYFSANNRLKFDDNWSAEIGGSYISSIESAQFTTGTRGGINIAVQRKLLKGKGNLKFLVNDIFYTQVNSGTINNLKLAEANYKSIDDTRYVAITFTYGFGKSLQSKNSDNRTGAESEQNRVKG